MIGLFPVISGESSRPTNPFSSTISVSSLYKNLHLHCPPPLSPSPRHLSHTQPEVKEPFSFRSVEEETVVVGVGWGGVACFQVLLLNGSLCQDPWAINMTMWQCGRAFLKEILCLLSVFPPEEPPQGRVRRPEKCPWKTKQTLITQCERVGPFD